MELFLGQESFAYFVSIMCDFRWVFRKIQKNLENRGYKIRAWQGGRGIGLWPSGGG